MQKLLEKKWLLFFIVGILLVIFIFLKEFALQLLKLIFLFICIGFVIYKTGIYIILMSSFLIKLVLSIFAFVLAIGGLGFILDFLSKVL